MKSIFSTLLIIFLLLCVVFLTYMVFNNRIDVTEFSTDKDYYASAQIDFDKDGKKDKIELIGEKPQNNNDSSKELVSVNLGIKYKLSINDQEFDITQEKGYEIISLGVADINGDLKNEILICTVDMTKSPSYREWMIYSFDGEFLRYAGRVYDGIMSYNYLSNNLTVIYQLHETRNPQYGWRRYSMNFEQDGFINEK